MRFDGTIKTWNDDRGFGFIAPTQGGQEIFVHIKAFKGLKGRPLENQRVTFDIELGPQGKKRAINVTLVASRSRMATPVKQKATQWGTASLFAIPALLGIMLIASVFGEPPRWALWLYPAVSVVTFLAYANDKAAAQNGSWRTSENTLHALAFAGGWPGALIAQQVLRHKSSKAEFRATFWGTVVLNLSAFMFLASPYAHLLQLI